MTKYNSNQLKLLNTTQIDNKDNINDKHNNNVNNSKDYNNNSKNNRNNNNNNKARLNLAIWFTNVSVIWTTSLLHNTVTMVRRDRTILKQGSGPKGCPIRIEHWKEFPSVIRGQLLSKGG